MDGSLSKEYSSSNAGEIDYFASVLSDGHCHENFDA
jgi:hypothetical protein